MDTFREAWSAFDRRAEELGHKLRRDEDGDIDHFVLEIGYHNGPGCELCREDWCQHCSSPDDIQPCDGGVSYRARVEQRELAELARLKAKYESASAMSASGQDPQGLEAKPASAVRDSGDAQ